MESPAFLKYVRKKKTANYTGLNQENLMSFANILYSVILYPLVQVIEIAFKLFDKAFSNTGIAVIGVSLTVTLLCLPLYIVAERWQETERKIQLKLKPGIKRIKEAFTGDEQYMILSTFYAQNHYHPMMALRSSFGLLIQIPFFMAAYSCLSSLPALQGMPFLFIKDMGKPDAVFSIGSFNINILPIAMTVINCIAGAIYSKGHEPREKVQIYGMALLFLVILYNSPAGLVLYWTMNNVFSLVKNVFYKLKNPLKILYILMCSAIVFVSVFIMFIYDGGASLKKRLLVTMVLLALIPLPIYIKFINFIYNRFMTPIAQNSALRIKTFIFTAAALCILFGLAVPSAIISSSVQEFSNIDSYTNPAEFLQTSFWQSFGVFIFWSLCIFFLFGKRIQTILCAVYSVLLYCGIADAYIFVGDYGSMDATLTFIEGLVSPSKMFILANLAVLAVLSVAAVFVMTLKKKKLCSSIACVSVIALSVLTCINVFKINSDYADFKRISESGQSGETFGTKFNLSKEKQNVIILMLDRAESSYFNDICKDLPQIASAMEGFVFYPNTVSFNGHTLMGSPPLYGGYEYTPAAINERSEVTLKDKHNEALLTLPRIFTEQADFTATLSDTSWGNYSYVSDMSFTKKYDKINGIKLLGRYTGDFKKNCPELESTASLSKSIERNLIWVSIFKAVPAALRPVVYYKGSWWASETAADFDEVLNWYSELYYLPKITGFDSPTGTLSVITNEVTHSNEDISFLNLVDKSRLSYKEEAYYINCAALSSVCDTLSYLKENGVYDNTRIIIVADHGVGYGSTTNKYYTKKTQVAGYAMDHLNPLLLVKDFNSREPLKTDSTFMTNADVPSIALEGIADNAVNPFTGKPVSRQVSAEEKKKGVLVTVDNIFMPHHSSSKNTFTVSKDSWFRVKENIFDSDNWTQEQAKE